jgi:hypothetical protein
MSLVEGTGRATRNGGPVVFEEREFLCIRDYTALPPFLMTVPSDSDQWMFVSSAGGLTAGRTDPDGALFPYVTVDELHDAHHHTGPVTLLRVRHAGAGERAWEPFAARPGAGANVDASLYKHPLGTPVVFEESNRDLGLVFRYRWAACDAFGHVRTAELVNTGSRPASIVLLDGVRNVLPFGAPLALYQHSGSLVDAYKRSELDSATGLGLFSLTSRISDRAEPAEELRANVVWAHGLPGAQVHLEHEALDAFRARREAPPVRRLNGRRGNYLVRATLELEPGARARWYLAADAGRDHRQVAALGGRLRDGGGLAREIERALAEGTGNLRRNVASADGLQLTADPRVSLHHLANVLYNNMRGGVFAKHHLVPGADFAAFVRTRNRPVAVRHAHWLDELPAELPVGALRSRAAAAGDPDLERLALDYLPLHFGRRHGDPSRPWNRFTIRVREADGSRALRYEGNWRDIFQNWEALATSFPAFLPGMVARFVNASTVDGFNPYRITHEGVDWEVEEPGHPWSNIGYWGDHQVVYLLRLLEALRETWPGTLETLLDRAIFSYAHVPYRIAPFGQLIETPRSTIRFDHELAAQVTARVAERGGDGRLVPGPDGGVRHVTLLEKLLVSVLARLSNLVPGAGIWMNTQRPEWNDANNALVGHGVSVVTLAHLRRMLEFLRTLLEPRREAAVTVSPEVARWAHEVRAVLEDRPSGTAPGPEGDRERFATLALLGGAFSRYREAAYGPGLSTPAPLAMGDVLALLEAALEHVDRTLRANERADGLYHAYNLLEFDRDAEAVRVHRLPEMLEGQVAVLSSGLVTPEQAVRLLDALFASRLHRPDQDSFMLYPEKSLPGFLETNVLPEARAQAVPLVRGLLEAGDGTLLARDAAGALRFAPGLWGEPELRATLERLAAEPRWRDAVARDGAAVLELYEAVFHHHAFTGRSGTMYGYEGIGSIYWHMVAKLLLAVQELWARAEREGATVAVRASLARHYDRVRGGLGFEKDAERWGAFPTDPYSHTPAGRGAQQPGMTGQVKEEILTRLGELGVRVKAGRVAFRPRLLLATEFLAAPAVFEACGHDGESVTVDVPADGLAFTYCAVPVVLVRVDGPGWLKVTTREGRVTTSAGDELDPETSRSLLERRGEIARIEVGVPARSLRAG